MVLVFHGRGSTLSTRGIIKWESLLTMECVWLGRANTLSPHGIVKWRSSVTTNRVLRRDGFLAGQDAALAGQDACLGAGMSNQDTILAGQHTILAGQYRSVRLGRYSGGPVLVLAGQEVILSDHGSILIDQYACLLTKAP